MAYEKIGFTSGQKLKASDLNHIEQGISELHGEWELISSETLTKGVNRYGKQDLNLVAAMIKMHTPAYADVVVPDLNGQFSLYPIYEGATTYGAISTKVINAVSADSDRYCIFGEISINRGMWVVSPSYSEASPGVPLAAANGTVASYSNTFEMSAKDYSHIERVYVHGGADGFIPAGTTIEIWGVRA